MYPYLEMPEMVSLGGGLPHPSTLCVRSGGSLSSYQLQAENSDFIDLMFIQPYLASILHPPHTAKL